MSAPENGYRIKLLSSLEKVFADTDPMCQGTPDLTMFRGETLSFQAAVKGPNSERETVEVRVVSPIRDVIRIRSVELVPSAYPCHPRHDGNYLCTVPGMFPDLLRELDGGTFHLIAGQWRALWIDVEAKTDTPAGLWPIEIFLLKRGEVLCRAATKVEIFTPVLPEQTLRHTEWFYADCLADYYHTEVFSEKHWWLIESFMRAAVRRGMNMFLTPCFTPPLDTAAGGERTTVQLINVDVKNGEYSFHFDRPRRWIGLVRKCGGKYIEIAHLFTQWGAHAAPKVMATVDGEYKRIFGWDTPAVGGAYTEFLKNFLPRLTEFLREQGVWEQTYLHISDEPSEADIDSYLAAKDSVQKELEGFKVIDALSSYDFYRRGVVENPVCSSDHIEPFLEHGVPNLWMYYCTSQCVGVSNRFMSLALLKMQPTANNSRIDSRARFNSNKEASKMEKIQFRPNPESDALVVGYLHNAVPEEMPLSVDRPCIVVYPGGGYVSLPEKESDPPALAFFAKGYQVFILSYSIGKKATDLHPLIDGSLTLMKIRENSKEWHVLPHKIAVLGFSAGGHAAASLGTLWDAPELKARVNTKGGRNKPDAMVLCYAVLTAGALTHPESVRAICGGEPTPGQVKFFSLENHVTPETPPTFLWHTVEDDCVPVENSMAFAEALRKNHVPFECHLFQKGRHGMSMCNAEVESENPHVAAWFPLCTEWLADLFQLFHNTK